MCMYVHVRAGDGITGPDCFCNPLHCYKNKAGAPYSKSKAFFVKAAENATAPYVIVANTRHHTAHCRGFEHQRKYMQDVLAFFAAKGPSIGRINGDIDSDFVTLASAPKLILCGGGFGKLAREVGSIIRKQEPIAAL